MPRRSVVVTAAAAPRATSGSRLRLYLSSIGLDGSTGHGVRRLVGDVGVLGEPQRVEPPLLAGPGQLEDADGHVGREDGDPVAHPPILTHRQIRCIMGAA